MENEIWKILLQPVHNTSGPVSAKVQVVRSTNCRRLQDHSAADHVDGYPVLARTRSNVASGDNRPNALVWEHDRQNVFRVRQNGLQELHECRQPHSGQKPTLPAGFPAAGSGNTLQTLQWKLSQYHLRCVPAAKVGASKRAGTRAGCRSSLCPCDCDSSYKRRNRDRQNFLAARCAPTADHLWPPWPASSRWHPALTLRWHEPRQTKPEIAGLDSRRYWIW